MPLCQQRFSCVRICVIANVGNQWPSAECLPTHTHTRLLCFYVLSFTLNFLPMSWTGRIFADSPRGCGGSLLFHSTGQCEGSFDANSFFYPAVFTTPLLLLAFPGSHMMLLFILLLSHFLHRHARFSPLAPLLTHVLHCLGRSHASFWFATILFSECVQSDLGHNVNLALGGRWRNRTIERKRQVEQEENVCLNLGELSL